MLNFKSALDDPDILNAKLESPDGLMPAAEIDGHAARIRRYVGATFGSASFEIISVHLLAALLAIELPTSPFSRVLWQASGIQRLLDTIRITVVDEGAIRRSQTLLGMLPNELATPEAWVTHKSTEFCDSAQLLLRHATAGVKRLYSAASETEAEMLSNLDQLMLSLSNEVPHFAEKHWESSQAFLDAKWSATLHRLASAEHIQSIVSRAGSSLRDRISDIIKEASIELELTSSLSGTSMQLAEQDSSTLARTLLKVVGIVTSVGAALMALGGTLVAPLFLLGTVFRFLASLFTSRSAKRAKAVQAIERSLREQINSYQSDIKAQARRGLSAAAGSVVTHYQYYFVTLAETMTGLSEIMTLSATRLRAASDDANRLFAKRVVDWAEERPKPLDRPRAARRIARVDRQLGVSMTIAVFGRLRLRIDLDRLSQTLHEQVSILVVKGSKVR